MITSSSNAQVKNIIQLNTKGKARREQGLFVVEGVKMFREAPKSWIHKVYISEELYDMEGWQSELEGYPFEIVEGKVFRQMCDTKTPQGILTVLRQPVYSVEEILNRKSPLLILLEDLQDPGNAGTILRTAEGAGVNGIFLTKNCVDLFNPKTIRSTMGSIYRMPFQYVEDALEFADMLKERDISVYAAHLEGKNSYDEEEYTGGTVFLIGNEGNGLSDGLAEKASHLIRIPMAGQVESLNAAMACGILVYEASRQRRTVDKFTTV